MDEAPDPRAGLEGAGRLYLTPRGAVAPELVSLQGRGRASDWLPGGLTSVDLVDDRGRRPVPYLLAAGGCIRQTRRVGIGPFTSSEGAVSGGFGVRVSIFRNAHVWPEVRLGIAPALRGGAIRPRR